MSNRTRESAWAAIASGSTYSVPELHKEAFIGTALLLARGAKAAAPFARGLLSKVGPAAAKAGVLGMGVSRALKPAATTGAKGAAYTSGTAVKSAPDTVGNYVPILNRGRQFEVAQRKARQRAASGVGDPATVMPKRAPAGSQPVRTGVGTNSRREAGYASVQPNPEFVLPGVGNVAARYPG